MIPNTDSVAYINIFQCSYVNSENLRRAETHKEPASRTCLAALVLENGPHAFERDLLTQRHLQGTMILTFIKYKYEQDPIWDSTFTSCRIWIII